MSSKFIRSVCWVSKIILQSSVLSFWPSGSCVVLTHALVPNPPEFEIRPFLQERTSGKAEEVWYVVIHPSAIWQCEALNNLRNQQKNGKKNCPIARNLNRRICLEGWVVRPLRTWNINFSLSQAWQHLKCKLSWQFLLWGRIALTTS